MSGRRDVQGGRIGPLLVIPLISGALLVAVLGLRLKDDISRFLPFLTRPITAVVTAGQLSWALAVADRLISRFAKLPNRLWRKRSTRWLGDIGLGVFVGGAALVSGVVMLRLSGAQTDQTG